MSNSKIKLVVFNEHTLGYILPEIPNAVQILHASVLKGATTFVSAQLGSTDKVRLASGKDFQNFRCSFEGYEKDPAYEFAACDF